MTTKDLTIREQGLAITPQEVVDSATVQAKLLMNIVEQTKCYQVISGKKYLQVEAWETIGAFNRTHAETERITPIIRDNETIGYESKVQLWKDGVVVGGAVMPCYFTENCCKGKEGDAKHKACMSAAQTFATSKAYRMNFSYVAILAGFQPLPAEEVTEDMEPNISEHYCPIHKVNFFKKGKMRGYSHPIEGTNPVEWCNEPSEEKPAPKTEPTPLLNELSGKISPVEDNASSNPPTDRPLTKEEFTKLYKLMADYQMDVKALIKWIVDHKMKAPPTLEQLPKSTYDKIMAGFKEG